MTMTRLKNWLPVAAILCALAACEVVLTGGGDRDVADVEEDGRIRVRVTADAGEEVAAAAGRLASAGGAAAARTVYPALALSDVERYTLRVLSSAEKSAGKTEEDAAEAGSWTAAQMAAGATTALETGSWYFYMYGYNDDGASESGKILRGVIENKTIDTVSKTLSFAMEPLSTGEGSIEIFLEGSPDSVEYVGALFNEAVDPEPLTWIQDTGMYRYRKSRVNAGNYRVVFEARGSGKNADLLACYTEVVWVRANAISRATITMSTDDLAFARLPVTGLSVAAVEWDRVDLSWNDVESAEGYEVLRQEDGGDWVLIGTVTGGTTTTYTDTTARYPHAYYYKVRGRRANGALSGESAATPSRTIPQDPFTLTAPVLTVTRDWSQMTLTWTFAVSGVDRYEVYRSVGDATHYGAAPLARVAGSTLTYTDTTVLDAAPPGGKLYYKVRAYRASGEGSYYSTDVECVIPVLSLELRLASVDWDRAVLTWSFSGATAVRFEVDRKTGTGEWAVLSDSVLTTTYTDTTVATGAAYFYRVRAIMPSGVASQYSNEVSCQLAETVPEEWTLTFPSVTWGAVTVNWTAIPGAILYDIERAAAADGPYAVIASSTTAAFTDATVEPLTTYWYRVRGRDANGKWTNYSVPGRADTPTDGFADTRPVNLHATEVMATWFVFAWDALERAARYRVERSASSAGPWTVLSVNVGAPGYIDLAVEPEATYWYRVRGIRADGMESLDSEPFAQTLPPVSAMPWGDFWDLVPTGLRVTDFDWGHVTLAWDGVPGLYALNVYEDLFVLGNYRIYRATSPDGPYTHILTVNPLVYKVDGEWVDQPVCVDTTVTPGTTYYYKVRGFRNSGECLSAYSDWAACGVPDNKPESPITVTLKTASSDPLENVVYTVQVGQSVTFTVGSTSSTGGDYVTWYLDGVPQGGERLGGTYGSFVFDAAGKQAGEVYDLAVVMYRQAEQIYYSGRCVIVVTP